MLEILGHALQVATAPEARINERERNHTVTARRFSGVPRTFELEVQFAGPKHEMVLNAV